MLFVALSTTSEFDISHVKKSSIGVWHSMNLLDWQSNFIIFENV